jgi:hypothetical protein
VLLRQGPSFAGPDFTLSFGNLSQCVQPLTVASVAAASAPRARPVPACGVGRMLNLVLQRQAYTPPCVTR